MIRIVIYISSLLLVSCGGYYARMALKAEYKADVYFQKRDFVQASGAYTLANRTKKEYGISAQAAIAAIKTGQKDKAIKIYQKLDIKSGLDTASLLKLADLYKSKKQYVEAKKLYLRLMNGKKNNNNYFAQQSAFCDSAKIYLNKKHKAKAQLLPMANSISNDIAPFVSNDTLYFVSDKEGNFIQPGSYIDGQPPYFVYFSPLKPLQKPKLLLKSSVFDDFANISFVSFSKNKSKMYFSCTSHKKNFAGDSSFRIKMYSTEKDSMNQWQKPHTFIMNDKPFSYAQPFVDEQDKMFFFASDMPGGFGGTDIWVCINIENKWTDPINLGAVINTPGNELFPFFHSDGSLYFASDFHPGFGGFDIFKASQQDGDWNKISNAGPETNSGSNEVSASISSDYKLTLFSSDRDNGKGKYDLYFIRK